MDNVLLHARRTMENGEPDLPVSDRCKKVPDLAVFDPHHGWAARACR
eukprot:COSAG06_NODE_48133_length_334_cov_0.880851_1_plen_46_part_01